jgi:hypothetical protein
MRRRRSAVGGEQPELRQRIDDDVPRGVAAHDAIGPGLNQIVPV